MHTKGHARQRAQLSCDLWPRILLGALIVVVTSCVSVEVHPITNVPVAATGTRAVTPGKGFGLTNADNDRTVAIAADTDVVRLVLTDDTDWNVQVDSDYLKLDQFGPVTGQGFTARFWLFRVLRTGETTVTAAGPSLCSPPGVSCLRQNRTFVAHLRIG